MLSEIHIYIAWDTTILRHTVVLLQIWTSAFILIPLHEAKLVKV